MGWSDMESRCKKHPSHRQSKGVCPSCLRERLAHLSATSSSTTTTHDSSSSRSTSIYLSDSNNTSPGGAASPPLPARGPKISRVKMAALLRARPEEPLTKSRSLAFVITETDGDGFNNKKAGKEQGRGGGGFSSSSSSNSSSTVKTKGFWARLMPGKATRRRLDDGVSAAGTKDIGALHSKTVKETASARWVL